MAKSKKIHLRKGDSGMGTLCNPNLIDREAYTIEEFKNAISKYPSEVCKKCAEKQKDKHGV